MSFCKFRQVHSAHATKSCRDTNAFNRWRCHTPFDDNDDDFDGTAALKNAKDLADDEDDEEGDEEEEDLGEEDDEAEEEVAGGGVKRKHEETGDEDSKTQ